MADIQRDERFFASTRGRVVTMLRPGHRTVDDLATELGLTDNAVRAHLASLERDGLVRQGDLRRGPNKPSFTYQLTEQAERLFPKAYGILLNRLLSVISERLPPADVTALLREVGHRIPAGPQPAGCDLPSRIEHAAAVLTSLGGLVDIEALDSGYAIQGCACPISAAVGANPDACLLAQTLLEDVIGAPVRQACDQGDPPRCRFEISAPDSVAVSRERPPTTATPP